MPRVVALVVVLAGCDKLFGLDELTGSSDATQVTGHFHALYTINNAAFEPQVAEHVYPPGMLSFAVTLDDGTQPAVDYAPDGTFSFPIETPGQRYRLIVSGDELQSAAPQLSLATLHAGRLDPALPTPAYVQFESPSQVGSQGAAWLSSTGIYTFTYTNQFGPTVMFDWRLAQPASRSTPGMLDASTHDRMYALDVVS